MTSESKIKNYIPDEVLSLLTGATVRVLGGLLHYRNRTSGRCCPRMSTIGKHLGVSRNTIVRHTSRLKRAGIVRIVHGRYSSQYDFAPTEEWVRLLRSVHQKWCSDCTKNGAVTGTLSLYEPLVVNLQKRTIIQLPPPITVLAEPEPEPAAAPSALETEAVAEQPPAPTIAPRAPIAASPGRSQTPHRHRDTPTASPEAILAGIADPDLRECVKQTFDCLMDGYPSPGLAVRGLELLTNMLCDADDPWALAKRLAESGEAWKHYWYRHTKAFQPQLWRWLSSGDWQFMPPEGRG